MLLLFDLTTKSFKPLRKCEILQCNATNFQFFENTLYMYITFDCEEEDESEDDDEEHFHTHSSSGEKTDETVRSEG